MSENLGIDKLPEKVGIEKTGRPDVSNLGIYKLPAKVAGIRSELEKSSTIPSNRILEKRLRGLDRRCKTTLQSVEKHKSKYVDRFGEDAVLRAEEELEQLSIQIQEIGSQRAADAMDKRIEKLRKMGYDA